MRWVSLVTVFAGALALAGCMQQTQGTWVRVDGQTAQRNPALIQQFQVDRTICEGEMQKANLSGSSYCRGLAGCMIEGAARGSAMASVGKGCMAQRGYMLVPDPNAPVAESAPVRN